MIATTPNIATLPTTTIAPTITTSPTIPTTASSNCFKRVIITKEKMRLNTNSCSFYFVIIYNAQLYF